MVLSREQIDQIRQKIAGSGVKIDFDSTKIDYYIQLVADDIEKSIPIDLSAAFKPDQAAVIIEVVRAIVFPPPPAPKEQNPIFDALTSYHESQMQGYMDAIAKVNPDMTDDEKKAKYKNWFMCYLMGQT